jgi:hypothetical protein
MQAEAAAGQQIIQEDIPADSAVVVQEMELQEQQTPVAAVVAQVNPPPVEQVAQVSS